MACPLGYKAHIEVEKPLPPDVNGNHVKIMEAFDSLLPKCRTLSTKLDNCRTAVVTSGQGHCLDQSREWMGCFNRRKKFSRLIAEACSSDKMLDAAAMSGQEYGDQLQSEYVDCMEKNGNIQATCLAPMKTFLQCATHVVNSNVADAR
jgi:hypothetical protein